MPELIRLSPAADNLLKSMCEHYKSRVSRGMDMRNSFYFGGAEELISILSLDETPSNISEISKELYRLGFINSFYGFDGLLECCLTQDGLNHYDQRFTRMAKSALSVVHDVADIVKPL